MVVLRGGTCRYVVRRRLVVVPPRRGSHRDKEHPRPRRRRGMHHRHRHRGRPHHSRHQHLGVLERISSLIVEEARCRRSRPSLSVSVEVFSTHPHHRLSARHSEGPPFRWSTILKIVLGLQLVRLRIGIGLGLGLAVPFGMAEFRNGGPESTTDSVMADCFTYWATMTETVGLFQGFLCLLYKQKKMCIALYRNSASEATGRQLPSGIRQC